MTSMTSTAASQPRVNRQAPTSGMRALGRSLRSEWIKARSMRSSWMSLAAGVILATAMSALISAAIGSSWDEQRDMYMDFNPVTWPLDGMLVTTIAFAVFGVTIAAGEYSSGMIRLTLSATPRRGRVLISKLAVVAALSATAGVIASLGMFSAAQPVYASYDMPTASLGDSDTLVAILATGALAAVFPVLGVAAGILLRSTAGAISAILALSFVPDLLGGLLPEWWQEHVISLLPGKAIRALAVGHELPDGAQYQDQGTAALAILAWVAVAVVAAWWSFSRRDA